MTPAETRNLEVKNCFLFFFCLCLLKFMDRLMFPPHSPPSDVFLSYLVTSFQKQTHIQILLGLSRKV